MGTAVLNGWGEIFLIKEISCENAQVRKAHSVAGDLKGLCGWSRVRLGEGKSQGLAESSGRAGPHRSCQWYQTFPKNKAKPLECFKEENDTVRSEV